MRRTPWLALCLLLAGALGIQAHGSDALNWSKLPDLPQPLGLGGPYGGVSHHAIIVAGGAHFPVSLFDGGKKKWVDSVFVLERKAKQWRTGLTLPRPLAYGASVTEGGGLVCIGGCDAARHYADVFRLRWVGGRLIRDPLPSLPQPCAFTCAALVGKTIYVAGGTTSPSATVAMKNFWALDTSKRPLAWQTLEPWPGPARMLAVAGALEGSFYLFSGAELVAKPDGKAGRRYLVDAYRFTPGQGWQRLADMPRPAAAAPSPATTYGQSQLLVFGGDDGANADKVFALKAKHPGFCRDVLGYDAASNSWSKMGELPAPRATAPAVPWRGKTVVPSGEDRPGHRSPQVWVAAPAKRGGATVFVDHGRAVLVRVEGKPWRPGKGYIECSGCRNFLWAGQRIGAGDFRIRVKLSLARIAHTAASFTIDNKSHFGFDGGGHKMFVEGRYLARRAKYLDNTKGLIKPGQPFVFEMVRTGRDVQFLIDGHVVHRVRWRAGELGAIGLRPWRNTMRVHEFSVQGETLPMPAPRTQPTNYTIPTIDLSREKRRQVVIAQGTADVYQGHPTTLLMPDGRTMFAVWTLGHGGCCGPMKKSADRGLTWSDLVPVPDNWSTVRNCPCIHRLVDPQGVARLFVFAGNGDMYQAVSEDEGKTWSPMKPNGLHCNVAPITIVPIAGNRLLAQYHRHPNDRDRSPLTIWQAISSDGGLTWSDERMVAERDSADLCEPAVIRSPDGKQLASLMRENSRHYNSMLITSDDEGETWSEPVELPASLTGDRHRPRYSHDGRIVMPFRDTAATSPTRGDFVAWVGTYDDIVAGREGQYRLRLIDSPVKGDLGYPGCELLPDGTFVATTYAVLNKGEKNSVVSVRFKLDEIDAKAQLLPQQKPIFVSGKDGCHTYRIPALERTAKGTLLAFCEGRRKGPSDHGDIDIRLKRSTDNGQTWSAAQVIWQDGKHTIGNPAPVLDRDTGTVWLLFCRNNDQVFVTNSNDDGVTWAKPIEITKDVKPEGWGWYATGPCHGIQLDSGRLLIPCNHALKGEAGMQHSHVIYSDDHGATWKLGGVLSGQTDECTVAQTSDGSLYLNMRSNAGQHRRAVAHSADGGLSWSEVTLDHALVEPVCQGSVIRYTDAKTGKSCLIFSNPASTSRVRLTVRLSRDDGKTWSQGQVLHPGPSAYSDLCIAADNSICCLYERGENGPREQICFARFMLEWLK